VDGQEVLARLAEMPISTWNYRAQDPSIRHVGPVAQDFYAAFEVGRDDRHIATIDLDGVALAAIQGLYQLSQEQDVRIEELEAENTAQQAQIDTLQQQNADLDARLAALETASANNTSPLQSALLPGAGPSAALGTGVLLASLGLVLSLPKGLVWLNRRGGAQSHALSPPKGLSKGGGR
jgi:hypothetical protein